MAAESDELPDPGSPPFAYRLKFLFDHVYPRGRGPYSQTEIVDKIRAAGGRMTTGYLSQLLSGKREAPGLPSLVEIATVFKVPMDYFGPAESYRTICEHLEYLCSVRDSESESIVGRTYDTRHALGVGLDRLRRNADTAE